MISVFVSIGYEPKRHFYSCWDSIGLFGTGYVGTVFG